MDGSANLLVALARFADDQYGDLVLLLVALSTKLKETGDECVAVDGKAREAFDRLSADGQCVEPGKR